MNKKKALLVFTFASAILLYAAYNPRPSLPNSFQNWKKTYNMVYTTPLEDLYRSKIFQANVEKINLHNSNPQRTYDMGVNQFTALTKQQFVAQYLSEVNIDLMKKGNRKQFEEVIQIADIDWVYKGAVTRVKTQGQCAASWAFSATGSLQALSKISYDNLRVFSDQQLLDCAGPLCSCTGGFTDMAFRYIQSHGLCQQETYPYTQVKSTCRVTQCTFKVSDYDYIDNCNGLGKLIAQRPISVAVQATNWAAYKSGIFSDCSTKVNSMALLVGVVQGNWKVKNSWGTSWGQDGFIRLAAGNTCGICSIGLYPLK